MKTYDWSIDGEYRVTVIGKYSKKRKEWKVSCYFKNLLSNKKKPRNMLMAQYTRTGKNLLNHNGFYSFIEDWNRSPGTTGYLAQRSAEFKDAVLRTKGNKKYITSVQFNINTGGLDEFAG